ncbi:hypothetical protein E1I69_11645 [Bacillus timonensis]|uniref:Uncharacterized protein n=1 Tax=Bacillus timonensis TaxID=1033734 RepID=A0A4S3PS17_9BACI|nr:hypothetical protein [Bacillus timonensis]THE12348.1 hypothetical protein E1I69_11645 [Bacillus timonensis]
MIVKYLNKGNEFIEFNLNNDLSGFISALQASETIDVNSNTYQLEGFELRTIGEDNSVLHQLLVFLTEK